MTAATNGKVYLFGGADGSYKSDLWEYDPATSTWTQKADGPSARFYHVMVTASDNMIYMFGGAIPNVGYSGELWKIDPSAIRDIQTVEIAASTDNINYIRNEVLSVDAGIIRDNSGTVLAAARDAKTAAQLASDRTYYNNNTAAYWGYWGYLYGYNAYGQTRDSATGKSAAALAEEASTNASTAATNASNAITAANNAKASADMAAARTLFNGKSAAEWASIAAQNAIPVINKAQGLNGATCTTGTSFTVVIVATPGSGVTYRVTCGVFDSGWVANSSITINSGLTTAGAKTATVQVKNEAGNIAQTAFTFFKI